MAEDGVDCNEMEMMKIYQSVFKIQEQLILKTQLLKKKTFWASRDSYTANTMKTGISPGTDGGIIKTLVWVAYLPLPTLFFTLEDVMILWQINVVA